jgi:hypothetical protein
VKGGNSARRPLAHGLLADGERLVDVPAKLSARDLNERGGSHITEGIQNLGPSPCWRSQTSGDACDSTSEII